MVKKESHGTLLRFSPSLRFQMLQDLCLGSDLSPIHSSKHTKIWWSVSILTTTTYKSIRFVWVDNVGGEWRPMKLLHFMFPKNLYSTLNLYLFILTLESGRAFLLCSCTIIQYSACQYIYTYIFFLESIKDKGSSQMDFLLPKSASKCWFTENTIYCSDHSAFTLYSSSSTIYVTSTCHEHMNSAQLW